ncbi:MAG: methylmalonyl-CoA epimerase [Candidatus Competibacteraceae bacterium]|nr:methylmalonyl-CoA epimerase [Candidatus Competibacteraceae bacterium]
MIGRIEHIGIAVKNLQDAVPRYVRLLGVEPYKTEEVLSEKVITVFFKSGENKVELLQASDPSSTIATFIEKRGEGIHHIAFHVEDIELEMTRLKQEGFRLLQEAPKKGADNKLICFVHPKDAGGVLIELCQDI